MDVQLPSVSGLLYVNSKITSSSLSADLFTRWYEDVHIPDIFETSGIKAAYRYQSTTPDSVERPYLALYPLKDLTFLQTEEFKSIPVHSEILPEPSHAVFDVADFDTRYYSLEKSFTSPKESNRGPARFVLSVGLRPSIPDEDVKAKFDSYEALAMGVKTLRSRLLKLQFARQNRLPKDEKKLEEPPGWLVLHEFETEDTLKEMTQKLDGTHVDASIKAFELLKAFGDTDEA
ncbi:hypothetical protein W97_06611 [Coniosporium apollinis CBS 100218]|uniref:EthD domain-containing protein n=1 Tax=Coniosporium apollinis (strain CBS 100218) TaxID=1168221 RepID=R7YZU1_CONA1|nr:uncharacterized protein W97_06611 [Coniosporium apollinis CBS 100218]EON67358.1 hypothetical protein W97_06611 [Coniosporium apollinis CBS 100218]